MEFIAIVIVTVIMAIIHYLILLCTKGMQANVKYSDEIVQRDPNK